MQGAWAGETVGGCLRLVAEEHGPAIAVCHSRHPPTFTELDLASERLGAALRQRGLRPGERVLFQVGNTVEGALAFYGAVKAGLVPICSIPQHGERDIVMLAERTNPSAYVFQADFRSQDLGAIAQRTIERTSGQGLLVALGESRGTGVTLAALVEEVATDEAPAILAGPAPHPTDIAVLQLSGGTTGTPKLIPRLHEEYVYNALEWARAWGWSPRSVVLHPIPLLHNAGLAGAMLAAHFCGATFATLARPVADDILDLIEREGVTVIPVTPPALLRAICSMHSAAASATCPRCNRSSSPASASTNSWPTASSPSSAVLPAELRDVEGMFLFTPPGAAPWVRKRSVGRPISPLDEVRLVEPGTERDVREGDVGELCCRGPYTVRGDHADPERDRLAFTSDGFYRTGDLARAHRFDDGWVYSVEGRIKDTINRGAEKISAEDVEPSSICIRSSTARRSWRCPTSGSASAPARGAAAASDRMPRSSR